MQIVGAVYLLALASLPSVRLWMLIGTGVGRQFSTPRSAWTLDIAMALLLIASLALVFV
ncbi:MAG: hypothetical protein OSB69_22675 [Alphaproteobacteria bacterium]|nr:hypothetical protein [Alphaproteobacteria bacterium]